MNIITKALASISPERALRREVAARKLEFLNYSQHGAGSQKRSTKGWLTRRESARTEAQSLPKLRERSNDLWYGNSVAVSAVKAIRTGVVGTGLKLDCSIDYEFLGLTREQMREWKLNTEREFRVHAESRNIDATRQLNFYQLQALVQLSATLMGDIFAALPYIGERNSLYKTCVMLIEADRVSTPDNKQSSGIIGGIECDKYGGPTHAYTTNRHPTDKNQPGAPFAWERVPFFDDAGNPFLLHIMQDRERVGQLRGVPFLAPVMEDLKQLGRYTDAELTNAVVSSYFTVFIKRQAPSAPGVESNVPPGMQISHAQSGGDSVADTSGGTDLEMSPGAVVELDDGEDIETANPGRAATAFEPYLNAFLTQIGAALELPREVLLKTFTASYSASRGALLEAWKMLNMRRDWLAFNFCQPVYEAWLAEAVAMGRIDAPGFFTDPAVRAAWCGAYWNGPSQGQLNPVQEVKAAGLLIDEGLSTRNAESLKLTGKSFDDIHPERAREEDARRRDSVVKKGAEFLPQNARSARKENAES